MRKAKRFQSAQKFNAALSIIDGTKTTVEVAQELGCHPTLVGMWKKELEEHGSFVFERTSKDEEKNKRIATLERRIGQLVTENDFLERVLGR